MIHENNQKNCKKMSLSKQKYKENLDFVLTYKKKQRKTTR